MKTKSGNVPAALAAALLLAAALCGCVTTRPESPAVSPRERQCESGPGCAGRSSSFSDEQYIWQDWLYGTNKSDKAWR